MNEFIRDYAELKIAHPEIVIEMKILTILKRMRIELGMKELEK